TNTITVTSATSQFAESATAMQPVSSYTASSTNGTTTILSNTAYKLSTSTMGTSTSYISDIIYTTSTLTSVSTSYISTESRTSTNTSFITSTSYTGTTSVTYTTTSFNTVYTATQSLTSTSTLSVPATVTLTIVSTKYKSTTSGLTTVTDTQTAQVLQTQTLYTSITTPGTPTTTQYLTVNTTVAPTLPFSCFIASAAYGSDASPSVQYLRNFRDQLVISTFAGSSFMEAFNSWYYSFSPDIADALSTSPTTKSLVRMALTPLFGILKVSASVFSILSFNPELGIIISGIVASSLIGAVYVMPLATPVLIGLKKRYSLKLKLRSLLPVYGGILCASLLILMSEIMVNGLLMRFSTATLVLSTMIGVAATLSLLFANKLDHYLSLKR
ncbi:CFI-box-CTERM domain-containing protein, partial [[Eubacterium] cellulosolvens]